MNIGRDDLGVCLHTALRKCCDSVQTSGAHLQIDSMPPDLWIEYIDVVWTVIQNSEIVSPTALHDLVKYASTKVYHPAELSAEEKRKNEYEKARFTKPELQDRDGQRRLLWMWFKCFSNDDWKGYTDIANALEKNNG